MKIKFTSNGGQSLNERLIWSAMGCIPDIVKFEDSEGEDNEGELVIKCEIVKAERNRILRALKYYLGDIGIEFLDE